MTSRVLTPELLDQLEHDHPLAVRSRADLKRINSILGNFRWMRQALESYGATGESAHIVEIGAGDGHFIRRMAKTYPGLRYTAVDLAPQPKDWPETLVWKQGDVMEILDEVEGDILIANLFLHHLSDAQLAQLGTGLSRFRTVICNEPARFRAFHVLGCGLRLIGVNVVTLHDLHASINAGFRQTELPKALGLEPPEWFLDSSFSLLGFCRMIATRQS